MTPSTIKHIFITDLDSHPKNPRTTPRMDVVEQIASQLNGAMDEAYALIVRPIGNRYEIVSGHHRKMAAEKAGLRKVPCWVREMSDEDAYMALVLNNAQGELRPLEIGMHQLGSGLTIRAYAGRLGLHENTVTNYVHAATVITGTGDSTDIGKFHDKMSHLSNIHSAPEKARPALVQKMIEQNWSLERTRQEVQETVAHHDREQQQQNKKASVPRKPHHSISLDEWKEMSEEDRKAVLAVKAALKDIPRFNEQEGPDIEWAQWSWNPVTGCEHNCPYCYARDIANSVRMRAVYPYRFEPTLHPLRLLAPQAMKVPKKAEEDERYKNVFTGSMADLFGRWVPTEWIEAVLTQVRAAPQWNFLFLTKFPGRMTEFDFPKNAWVGTSVDLKARIPAAEKAFAKINAKVKWLSVEPMLEPLEFKHLDLFQWIVVGGASKSSKTPEWKPPTKWIFDIYMQAEKANCKFYAKNNLFGSTCREGFLSLPMNAPIPDEKAVLPDVFNYLKTGATGNDPTTDLPKHEAAE